MLSARARSPLNHSPNDDSNSGWVLVELMISQRSGTSEYRSISLVMTVSVRLRLGRARLCRGPRRGFSGFGLVRWPVTVEPERVGIGSLIPSGFVSHSAQLHRVGDDHGPQPHEDRHCGRVVVLAAGEGE